MADWKIGRLPNWLAYFIGFIALANFFSFVLIAESIGGDAWNGHQAAGHYFLANHGHLTEVSRATFQYSKWHVLSLFVTHPLAMLAGWLWYRQKKSVT